MVTVQKARSQISIQRAAVESQRQQIQQRTRQPTLTAAEVRQQTRSSLAQRQLQSQQLSSLRKEALQTLVPIEAELTKAETQIRSVESQLTKQRQAQSDFEQAKKLFRKGIVDPGASQQIKKFIREFEAGREIAVTKQITEAVVGLERRGLEPIFINGELRGVEDFLRQQSRTLEQLEPVVINGKLVGFQDIAQQLSRQLREPIAVEVAPIERITFGQPEKFAESFRQATNLSSFTLAIPIGRENGKVRVQDFNFRFENGQLVRSKQTGSALLTEAQFLAADKRRREKNPEFTFGSTLPVIPPGVVRPGETNIEALVRNIKESSPQLRFIKNEALRNLARAIITPTGIPVILGTERFLVSELKRILSDPRGAFKFRPDQAEPLAELIKEVAEGFVLGAGVGKGVTLLRGAATRIIPKALQGSSKFDNVLKIAGTLGVITLTAAQAVSIKNTFEKEGEEAAILQTVGLLSFGSGFTKTGLKSLPQAEKEFKQITDLLKKVVPPGRRGEIVIGRKRRKGDVGLLTQLGDNEIEQGRAVVLAIERRLINAKNPKEQAKILAELKKRLKTKQAQQNFERFVLDLINKDVIKIPKVEVAPGITVRGLPARKGISVITPLRLKPGRAKEIARVKRNQARNTRRVQRSKLTLGQRFRLAQGTASVTTIASAQTLGVSTKLTSKQRTKQIQKTKQVQKAQQRLRQRLLQKTRQTSKLALRQLLKTSFRSRLTRVRPIVFKPFAPLIPLPKRRVKKKKLKTIPFNIKGESFNVLVRKKGKFVKIFSSLPENRAKRRLLNVLDKTLAASGRIVPSDVAPIKKDIKKLNIPAASFRRPVPKSPLRKKNTFTIVERRSKRLNTRTEIKAIQQAKKLKRIPMNLKVK
ncbi:hypothetical protein LCGC14_0538330 [marine sediment metagenome]|uniref:Uncharacterized protein n=1 Tax=marine sediment metagenome TaxID=412755 RepID=A0A0F9RTR7_9ZZZZ|nr:hypothetical protein [bacterium]